jgi:hypothetical protein
MKRSVPWLLAVATVAILTTRVAAHHPVGEKYFIDRTGEIEGTLVEFQLRNPHSFVFLEVQDGQGHVQRWTLEWLATVQLNRQGVTIGTLKPGDRLVVTGYPARDASEHQMRLRTVSRPKDGWRWTGTFQ